MPALSAPIEASPAAKALGSFSDLLKSNLENGVPDNLSEDTIVTPPVETAKAPEKVEPTTEPKTKLAGQEKPAEKQEQPKEPDKAKLETKAEPAKTDKEPEKQPTEEKKGPSLYELPPDQQDFVLKASQKRQLEAFNAKNERIKALEEELAPLKSKLSEVEGKIGTVPQELEQARARIKQLEAENSEFDTKVCRCHEQPGIPAERQRAMG